MKQVEYRKNIPPAQNVNVKCESDLQFRPHLISTKARISLSRFLDRHFGFLWRFLLTTRSQTSVPRSPFPAPRSPLPAPRSPFPVLVTSREKRLTLSYLPTGGPDVVYVVYLLSFFVKQISLVESRTYASGWTNSVTAAETANVRRIRT